MYIQRKSYYKGFAGIMWAVLAAQARGTGCPGARQSIFLHREEHCKVYGEFIWVI